MSSYVLTFIILVVCGVVHAAHLQQQHQRHRYQRSGNSAAAEGPQNTTPLQFIKDLRNTLTGDSSNVLVMMTKSGTRQVPATAELNDDSLGTVKVKAGVVTSSSSSSLNSQSSSHAQAEISQNVGSMSDGLLRSSGTGRHDHHQQVFPDIEASTNSVRDDSSILSQLRPHGNLRRNGGETANVSSTMKASSSNDMGGEEQAFTDSPTEEESELLRETFQVRNPMVLPGYFDNNGGAADTNTHIPKQPSFPSALPKSPKRPDADAAASEDGSNKTLSIISKRRAEYVAATKHNDENSANTYDDAHISVEQRSWRCSMPNVLGVSNEDLPWTCRQRWVWRYLGEHVYPSRIYEAHCEGRTCWYGHFNCTPITYTLHVLQVCLRGCHDQRVPFPLRSRWQWTDLNVTVGCQCVR